jgi:hypothetical protein
VIADVVPAGGTAETGDTRAIARQEASPAAPQPRAPAAGIPAPQRPAAPRSAPLRYAAEWNTAALAFRARMWTAAELASALDMKERTARERLNVWLGDGRAAKSDTQGHFYLTESEGA